MPGDVLVIYAHWHTGTPPQEKKKKKKKKEKKKKRKAGRKPLDGKPEKAEAEVASA